MLAAFYELRSLTDPLALAPVFPIDLSDVDGVANVTMPGYDKPLKSNVVHVDVPGFRPCRGAYIRTPTHEWTCAIAEADRFVGMGAQRLFAAVRDQTLTRHNEHLTEQIGKMPEMRTGGSTKPKPLRAFVPR